MDQQQQQNQTEVTADLNTSAGMGMKLERLQDLTHDIIVAALDRYQIFLHKENSLSDEMGYDSVQEALFNRVQNEQPAMITTKELVVLGKWYGLAADQIIELDNNEEVDNTEKVTQEAFALIDEDELSPEALTAAVKVLKDGLEGVNADLATIILSLYRPYEVMPYAGRTLALLKSLDSGKDLGLVNAPEGRTEVRQFIETEAGLSFYPVYNEAVSEIIYNVNKTTGGDRAELLPQEIDRALWMIAGEKGC